MNEKFEGKKIDSIETSNKKREELLDRYVNPHNKNSRLVTKDDLPRVLEESHILYNLCFVGNSKFKGGLAVAHPQIDDKDPLQLFVTKSKKIVINPYFVRHTQNTVDSLEGCLTFPDEEMVIVQRWNKCEVKYYTIEGDGEKMIEMVENLSGREAKVFQHEMQHFIIPPYENPYIYDLE